MLLVACGAKPVGDDRSSSAVGAPLRPGSAKAVFPNVTVTLEIARTEAERSKGLGGHAPLAERAGMLFIFDEPSVHSFWMKDMSFDLDMLWLLDGKVVHLERDVPAKPGAPDSQLPVYTPRSVAKYVLEVNAGFTKKYGIELGTPVDLRGV